MMNNEFSPRPISPVLKDMVEEMNYLYVRVESAAGLYGGEAYPEYDPFVEVRFGGYRSRTSHVERNPDPRWKHIFAFPRDGVQATSVDVCVMNHSAEGEGVRGYVSVPMNQIPKRVPPDSSLAAQPYGLDAMNGGTPKGQLMMAVWVGTQADEKFNTASHVNTVGNGASYVSPILYYLRVYVIEVRNLDRNKTKDVFVKARVKGVISRTGIAVIRNRNATWRHELMFVAIEGENENLFLTVEERVGNREEVIGTCVVPLLSAVRRPGDTPLEAKRHTLLGLGENNAKVASGEILLKLSADVGYHVLEEGPVYSSDVRPTEKHLWKPQLGTLDLGILGATGLKARAGTGKPGAYYCVAKYGRKWVKTRTLIGSLSPKWNQQYCWEVFDPCTVITVGVFDDSRIMPGAPNGVRQDVRIGKIRIRVSTLEAGRIYAYSYPLLVLHPRGLLKSGELQLAIRFTSSSLSNLLQVYIHPTLPRMHYTHPLTSTQEEELGKQAIQVVCQYLAAKDPPLKREVIDYMLDSDSKIWSIRRTLSNHERIKAFFSSLDKIMWWISAVCSWRIPWLTGLVHLFLIILVFIPQVIIPSICMNLVVLGFWNYRSRPKILQHIDRRLSCMDRVMPRDLEEEFDRSNPPGCDIGELSYRYNRLRQAAGSVQTKLGWLATQLERLQSLVNWRDRRATALFLAFCVAASVIFFVIPLRAMFVFLVFFILRPPQFRNRLPFVIANFFRRLPSKTDSLL